MRIPLRMAETILESGNEVILGASVTRLVCHEPNDIEVFYTVDGKELCLRADAVVSTIPVNLLTRMISPVCDKVVTEAAKGLEFRNLITVNLTLARRQVSRDTWLYVQDGNILFARMHEPKNWSRAMVPDDEHTSLVLECFCSPGDAIWNMVDDEIRDRCIGDLADKLGFIEKGEVEDAIVVRTSQAYPVYDLQYGEKLAAINAFLEKFEGLHMIGRGGTFRYNNTDHSIVMGLLLGQKLLGQDVDYKAINIDQEYHEIKREETQEKGYSGPANSRS